MDKEGLYFVSFPEAGARVSRVPLASFQVAFTILA